MKHILFATDFSDNAEPAQKLAVSIALQHGASLTLVHGIVPIASPAGFLPAPEAMMHTYREAAQERLSALEHRLNERVANVDSVLVFGPPHRAILEAAENLDPDLLILGTRGLTGLRHILLGSTAQRVLQHSSRPVVTVPASADGSQRPIERILLPTDFSNDARAALQAARLLLSTQKSSVLLLNVYYSPILYTAYGSVPTTGDYLEDFRGESLRALRDKAAELDGAGLEIEVLSQEGSPAEVILDVAAERQVDLIAMGTRGRSGLSHLLLGSTAERVVQKADRPVLTVSCREESSST